MSVNKIVKLLKAYQLLLVIIVLKKWAGAELTRKQRPINNRCIIEFEGQNKIIQWQQKVEKLKIRTSDVWQARFDLQAGYLGLFGLLLQCCCEVSGVFNKCIYLADYVEPY